MLRHVCQLPDCRNSSPHLLITLDEAGLLGYIALKKWRTQNRSGLPYQTLQSLLHCGNPLLYASQRATKLPVLFQPYLHADSFMYT